MGFGFQRPKEKPVFSPEGAIGWEFGPLDGLSCYLRCIESVLRAHQLDQRHVVNSLLQGLDLLRTYSSSSSFHGCTIEWHQSENLEENWKTIEELLEAGEPVILSPDVFYWPGHKFENQKHSYDHMVLLTHVTDGFLSMLDTDAPADSGFVRKLEVNETLLKACSRFGRVRIDFAAPILDPREVLDQKVRPHLPLLREAILEIRDFGDRWKLQGIPENTARALHVVCLGDIQPQLRLLSIALQSSQDPLYADLASKAARASERAMQLGLALLSEHGYLKGEPYELSKIRLRNFIEAMELFCRSLSDFLKADSVPLIQTTAGSHFENRLNRLVSYLY